MNLSPASSQAIAVIYRPPEDTRQVRRNRRGFLAKLDRLARNGSAFAEEADLGVC
jgi:hypothetical protein